MNVFDYNAALKQRDVRALQRAAREEGFVPTLAQVVTAMEETGASRKTFSNEDHFFLALLFISKLTFEEKNGLLLHFFRRNKGGLKESMMNGVAIVGALLLAGANPNAGNLFLHHALAF